MCERIQWLGQSAPDKQNNISVITQTKEVQNWDIEEAVPKCIFTREKIIAALRVIMLLFKRYVQHHAN